MSTQHATLRWTGQNWELKDLGSLNGTFVGERRLQAGAQEPIQAGVKLHFGHEEQQWILDDESEPVAMLIAADGAEPLSLAAESGLIAVPSIEDPQAAIYRGSDGRWLLEREGDALLPIEDQSTFGVAGRAWRFSCPNVVLPTSLAAEQLEVRDLALRFSVSRDEEHVELRATSPAAEFNLGSRTHHYLLLTLARLRLKEAAEGLADSASGWIYQDELVERLGTTDTQLNVDVFRIRQQFSNLNVSDFAQIIERRPRSRQLRIGATKLHIELL